MDSTKSNDPARSQRIIERRRARRRVMQALYQWQITGDAAQDICEQFIETQNWKNADISYFKELLSEVCDQCEALDAALKPFLDRDLAHVDMTERAILRLATAELINHPELPVRVVLDEAIDLARRFGAEGSFGFVNGVLDPLARRLRPLEFSDESE